MHRILALALVAAAGPALAQTPDAPHYVSAKDLNAQVAQTADGLATFPVPTGPGVTIVYAHRDRSGEVEVHDHLADEFVVQAGKASVRVGGQVKGNRLTAPGEWRGGEITGGQTFELAPGDVLWIPAGQPHQVVMTAGGSFTYIAAKFPTKP